MKSTISLSVRRSVVFAFDLVAIGFAFYAAFLIRFDFRIPPDQFAVFLSGLPWIYIIQSVVFTSLGLYRGIWAYASLRDLFLILRAVALAVVLSISFFALSANHLLGWPRSVFLLDAVLLVLTLGGGRFAWRFGREFFWNLKTKKKRILILGAGHSANLIAREISSRPEIAAEVVGYLDDNAALKGMSIQGAHVLGTLVSLPSCLERLRPDEIIIAIPSLSGHVVKEIISEAHKHSVPCRICPPIQDVLLGKIELNQIREVRVEDVLRRDVVQVDDAALSDFIKGKSILVTGAGGSIGSELCRQVLRYHPRTLVLYERSEFNMYRFEQELKRSTNLHTENTELVFMMGDILNVKKLTYAFEKYSPEIVLHAAAYKHVPLMEENIYEALLNNSVGTHHVASAAAKAGVKTFVLISTDKAVRPSSVMGATKRMTELITHEIGKTSKMRTVAVRFGNVLDSDGSVLPLFRSQIAAGGPVTVTDPRVTRYFMTIPEASQLVLQASLLGRGGEVFLLDMGEPVLIKELAEELIKLSGLRPYHDIDIVFTGLRKGEKLYEELLIDMDLVKKTSHPKIMVSTKEHEARIPKNWTLLIDTLTNGATIQDDEECLKWIRAWVPECSLTRDYDSDPAPLETAQENNLLH